MRAELGRYLVEKDPNSVIQHLSAQITKTLGVPALQVRPHANSGFNIFSKDAAPAQLWLRMDSGIFPDVVHTGRWQADEVDFLAKTVRNLPPGATACLIDIGANQGLITRQLFSMRDLGDKLTKAICFEPEPENFAILSKNLACIPCVEAHQLALSDEEGEVVFHLDPNNVGNFSLVPNAETSEVAAARVKAVNAGQFFEGLRFAENTQLIYKSDTQGADITIFALLPLNILKRIAGGVIEIWRLPGRGRASDAQFLKNLEGFDHFSLRGREVSLAEIATYLQGEDNFQTDLYFLRKGR